MQCSAVQCSAVRCGAVRWEDNAKRELEAIVRVRRACVAHKELSAANRTTEGGEEEGEE
jgi:hypothetical protein